MMTPEQILKAAPLLTRLDRIDRLSFGCSVMLAHSFVSYGDLSTIEVERSDAPEIVAAVRKMLRDKVVAELRALGVETAGGAA